MEVIFEESPRVKEHQEKMMKEDDYCCLCPIPCSQDYFPEIEFQEVDSEVSTKIISVHLRKEDPTYMIHHSLDLQRRLDQRS
jgi:hypothetical protein